MNGRSIMFNSTSQLMKSIILLSVSILSLAVSQAQYEYEPSDKHPFGLPNPEAPEQIRDWSPMIGECDCISTSRGVNQEWGEPTEMMWRFKYILNGNGIQDETLKADGQHAGSIRQFIADSSKWYVHYYSSKFPSTTLPAWEGTKVSADSIVLYRAQKAPNGMDGYYKIIFSDMSDKGFNWLGQWVNTDETITYPTWKIKCTKRED